MILELPVNSLSLGYVSVNILRELFSRGQEISIFPIGEVDLSAYQVDQKFHDYLVRSINNRFSSLKKDTPCIKNWHIQDSDKLRTHNQVLLTYHETDRATDIEKTIVNLQKKTLFCGNYSENIFRSAGCDNVGSFSLGIGPEYFKDDKNYFPSRIHWGLCHKWENRKLTAKIISLWTKKYGNNSNHSLSLLVNNPFFSPEDNQRLLQQTLENKRFHNINVLPRLATHAELNQFHNAIDIDLGGIAPSESWNLPPFTSTCLGKWAIVTNSAGNTAWANDQNSILIEPSGMRPSHDGVFFKDGGLFNQGQFFDVIDNDILESFNRAEKLAKKENVEGLLLPKKYNFSKTVNLILEEVR